MVEKSQIKNKQFSFRLSLLSYQGFLDQGMMEQLNTELLIYLTDIGLRAKLMGPSMKGGGYNLTLLLRLIGYVRTYYKALEQFIAVLSSKNLANAAPKFLLDVSHIRVGSNIFVYEQTPGLAQIDLLYASLIIHDWFKHKFPRYELQITSRTVFSDYNYILECSIKKNKVNETSIGLLINFVQNAKLKLDVNEYIVYGDSPLIKHTKYVNNMDHRLIRTITYRYFKLDRIFNGLFWSSGLSIVELAKGGRVFRTKPRLKKTNI